VHVAWAKGSPSRAISKCPQRSQTATREPRSVTNRLRRISASQNARNSNNAPPSHRNQQASAPGLQRALPGRIPHRSRCVNATERPKAASGYGESRWPPNIAYGWGAPQSEDPQPSPNPPVHHGQDRGATRVMRNMRAIHLLSYCAHYAHYARLDRTGTSATASGRVRPCPRPAPDGSSHDPSAGLAQVPHRPPI
jgi:hypothetical protein